MAALRRNAQPRRRTVLEPSPDQKETVRSLRTELRRLDKEVVRRDKENARLNTRLDQEKERTERIRETAKKLSSESLRLHREVRILGDSEARARSLSDEVFWLRHALEVSKAGKEKLKARLVKLRAAGATLSKLPSDEAAQLRATLRRSRRQKTTLNALRKENARPHRTVRKLETRKAALEVQPAKLRAIRKTLSKSLSVADADLRRALRRSRRQKATIKSLSRENARLRKGAKTSRNRIETLEVQLERLRATGAVLSRALYGRKSEQQDKPGSEHKRGQQRGAPGHGRTQRPGLAERTEEHNPPPDACVCGRCGQPYAPNSAEESTLVEIEVKAYKRVIRRPRWRRTCACASSPMEVSAPPVPRLFPRTLYGTSFWARFLFEHCACFRPVHRVAAWMSAQGLTVSPGTLADSLKRFVPLFEPLAEAILAHQNKAALRHADETSWRVQELRGEDRSSRAWLWVSVSNDAVSFHIDPSRSAEAAQKLFGDALLDTVIVCDRYSAYKRPYIHKRSATPLRCGVAMGKHYGQLDLDERIELFRHHDAGTAPSEIARIMGRHPSTIGRELRRNSLPKAGYKPASADRMAFSRRRRSSRIERLNPLRDHVDDHLAMGWSPEQIAGRLRLEGSEHRVSHESIYRYIYRPKVRPRKLYRYLPRAKASRGRRYFKRRRAPIPGRRSIHERGQAIDNRATFGHWEGDLMQFRTQRGNLLTAVERKTGLTLATGLPTKTAEATAAKLTALFADLPKPARRSITFDNGSEFAHHDKLERDLGLISFFCDPHSPWQRGSIENANGIIRRDLPRKTDFADYTEQDIQDIVWVNNTTPRKRLGYLTPAEAFLNQIKRCT